MQYGSPADQSCKKSTQERKTEFEAGEGVKEIMLVSIYKN